MIRFEKERGKDKNLDLEWMLTHNAIPLLFTTFLALIGIIGFFANIGTQVQVTNARVEELKNEQGQYEKLFTLLNDQVNDKLKIAEVTCRPGTAVMGVTTVASRSAKKL